jgi:hypothetical protein
MSSSSEGSLAAAINRLATVHAEQLGAIAKSIDDLAVQVKYLGNGETISSMGAIEFLGTAVQDLAKAVGTIRQD